MRRHFADVLAREAIHLAAVTDRSELLQWRQLVVRELMTPESPYVSVLQPTGDVAERAEFLDRWRDLIAGAVERLPGAVAVRGTDGRSCLPRSRGAQAQQSAMLILAALHGGNALSRVAQDRAALDAALDMAFSTIGATGDNPATSTMNDLADQ